MERRTNGECALRTRKISCQDSANVAPNTEGDIATSAKKVRRSSMLKPDVMNAQPTRRASPPTTSLMLMADALLMFTTPSPFLAARRSVHLLSRRTSVDASCTGTTGAKLVPDPMLLSRYSSALLEASSPLILPRSSTAKVTPTSSTTLKIARTAVAAKLECSSQSVPPTLTARGSMPHGATTNTTIMCVWSHEERTSDNNSIDDALVTVRECSESPKRKDTWASSPKVVANPVHPWPLGKRWIW